MLLYSYEGCFYEVNIHGKEIKVVESKENSQEYKEFNNFNNVSIEDSIGLIDTLYNDDMSVYVYEDHIKVIENNQEIILNTNCKSIFLKARFIKCNGEKCLIVLSTNKNDTCENNISIYKL